MYKYLLTFLIYLLALAFLSNSALPQRLTHNNFFPYLADKPIHEDGFYMLTVAHNFADGKGLCYNNGLKTTGIQPLVILFYAAIFKVVTIFTDDRVEQLRLIILFSGSLIFILSIIIHKILLKIYSNINYKILKFVSVVFVLFNFDFFINFTNGLETGFYILMIALSVLISLHYLESSKNFLYDIALGLIFGLTILTRIDFVLPLIVYLVLLLFYKSIATINFIRILLLFVSIFSVWLFYIYEITGTFFQSSASAQTSLLGAFNYRERIYEWLVAIAELLTLNVYFGNKENFLFIVAGAISIILIYLVIKKNLNSKLNNNIKYWAFAFLSLIVVYPVLSSAPYFYYRYLIPFSLFGVLFIPAVIDCDKIIVNFVRKKISLIAFLFMLSFFLQAFLYFHNRRLGVSMSLRAGYILKNFPGQKVGCFQSGVAGYFNQNVYNLDGKIDHEALRYNAKGEILDYIDKKNINVLIEWKETFPIGNKNKFFKNWVLFDKNIGDNRTSVYIRNLNK